MEIRTTIKDGKLTGFNRYAFPDETEITVDSTLLTNGYDHEFYNFDGARVTPKSEQEVQQIRDAREAEEQRLEQEAIGNDVILQHMIQEKKAELQWDSSAQYHIGDVVYHNGAMWRATSNNSNNEPDDVPGDWEKVT